MYLQFCNGREMNKVQTAINAQLEQVVARQKYLGISPSYSVLSIIGLITLTAEGVNVKLRKSSEDVRAELLQLRCDQADPGRLGKLQQLNTADMSIPELAELVILR